MTTETPRDRFERVIRPRIDKAQKAIELIGNGASRDYETTPEEIAELLNGLQQTLWDVERRYARRLDCPVQIFDAVEGGKVEAARSERTAPPDDDDATVTPAGPAVGEGGPHLTAAVAGLQRGHVPLLVTAVPESLLSAVITQLVHRAMDLVETKGSAT